MNNTMESYTSDDNNDGDDDDDDDDIDDDDDDGDDDEDDDDDDNGGRSRCSLFLCVVSSWLTSKFDNLMLMCSTELT